MTKYLCILALLLSCSSLPKKEYVRTGKKSLLNHYIQLADSFRLTDNHQEALSYYSKAIEITISINDIQNQGILHLKRASIYLDINKMEKSVIEINVVTKLINYRSANLKNELLFIQAKKDHLEGMNTESLVKIDQLIITFKENTEKYVYYSFKKIEFNGILSITKQEKLIDNLVELYNDGELENIEILNYSYFQYAYNLMKLKRYINSVQIIKQALIIYSKLENTRNIKKSYLLLSENYQLLGNIKQSNYYKSLFHR